SPEAERAGIRPGLPLREVVPLCPEAVIVQPDPVRVAAVLEQVARALLAVSPVLELADEALLLDLRGIAPLYGGDLGALERAIRAAVPPLLLPRIGVGPGKRIAAIAARAGAPHATYRAAWGPHAAQPAGLRVVPPGEAAAFLAPLPIRVLPFDPAALARLELLGLRRVGDLAALPPGAVQAQLGPPGLRAWRVANGQDDEPLVPYRPRASVRATLALDDPIASVDAVLAALERLLVRAYADPALANRAARRARLSALLADGGSWELRVAFKMPAASPAAARSLLRAKLLLPGALPAAAVAELTLELEELGGE